MGKKLLSVIAGTMVGEFALMFTLLLADETNLIVYTTNKVQIYFMLFSLYTMTFTVCEKIMKTLAWEPLIDMVISIILALITCNVIEFTGAKGNIDYLFSIGFPILGIAVFSTFFSPSVSDQINGKS